MVPLGDLPLNIAVAPSRKLLAVTNNGQSTQQLMLFDGQSLYASGGNDNWIVRFSTANKRLVPTDTFRLGEPWPERIWVAGIQVDEARQLLYAVTTEDNSLYIYDMKGHQIIRRLHSGGR